MEMTKKIRFEQLSFETPCIFFHLGSQDYGLHIKSCNKVRTGDIVTKVEKVKAKTQQDYKESIIEYEYLSWITKRKIGNWEHEKIARVKCGDVLNHWRRKRVSRGPETWTQLRFSACSSSIDRTSRVLVVLTQRSKLDRLQNTGHPAARWPFLRLCWLVARPATYQSDLAWLCHDAQISFGLSS